MKWFFDAAQRKTRKLKLEVRVSLSPSRGVKTLGRTEPHAQKKTPKPLQIVDLGDEVQGDATLFASSGGGTRTPDTRIMIPLL